MSMPPGQQPPPVTTTAQHSYNTHSSHDSAGPFIAVLVVIIILGVLAGMIGQLCSRRRIMGYGQYDIEKWAETKCSSCIDGTISSHSLPMPNVSDITVPTPVAIQTHQSSTHEERTKPPAAANVDS